MTLFQMILIPLILILTLTNCRTKTSAKSKSKVLEKVEVVNHSEKDSIIKKNESKKTQREVVVEQKEKKSETEVEIKGKAETDKPLEFHEIENGDTLQTIKIIGNAEVSIKSKRSNSEVVKKETSIEKFENKLEHLSRSMVKEQNIKETTKEIKEATKEIKIKDFTLGAWVYGIIGTALLVGAIWLFVYFRKNPFRF